MNKGTFGVHKIEFMINTGQSFSNSSSVGNHTYSTLDTGKITTWYNSWRLVVDTTFETSWTPINKLYSTFCFDSSNSRVNIFWYYITTEHHTTSHIFTMTRITFG
mmetsp:Transcript_131235/g.318810  ORF Transcript_131235/g.318810 Transcript_131235/m.318810 type:complete len:105 (+) Transcript_131235:211-525(+)